MAKLVLVCCVLSVCLCAPAQDLGAPPLEIKGTKVSSEAEAKRLAFESYAKRMNLNILAEEGTRDVSIIKLGYDMPQFAIKGEDLWEVRVKTLDNELRAIIWINPKTEKVHFVTGAWETTESGNEQASGDETKVPVNKRDNVDDQSNDSTGHTDTEQWPTFMRETVIVKADGNIAETIRSAILRLEVWNPEKKDAKGVQTLSEAARFISENLNMACPPGACTEYEGYFVFSGGTSTKVVTDFSRGVAMKKGETKIYRWSAEK